MQHQLGDRLGHVGQQLVALFASHVASTHQLVEQDLDIDLVVRTVHAARVVDEIGIARPAVQGVLDAPELGHAEVATLAHDAGAQFVAIDPHRIVGLVTDIGMALGAALDIGADATVPQQIDRSLEQRVNELGRGQLIGVDREARLHLRGDEDTFGRARKHPAPGGDQAGIVVGP